MDPTFATVAYQRSQCDEEYVTDKNKSDLLGSLMLFHYFCVRYVVECPDAAEYRLYVCVRQCYLIKLCPRLFVKSIKIPMQFLAPEEVLLNADPFR
jgi:hypothetical protein